MCSEPGRSLSLSPEDRCDSSRPGAVKHSVEIVMDVLLMNPFGLCSQLFFLKYQLIFSVLVCPIRVSGGEKVTEFAHSQPLVLPHFLSMTQRSLAMANQFYVQSLLFSRDHLLLRQETSWARGALFSCLGFSFQMSAVSPVV
uniref:Uncharacterized protein n=1 Tax=Myotis myotis TaxID=51298 RepID=A0A7J7R705_MYOMY|nr:hypothetical protein mMyoMyo1_010888 [Myotis myotis]